MTDLSDIEVVYLGRRLFKDTLLYNFITPELLAASPDPEHYGGAYSFMDWLDRRSSAFSVKGTGPNAIGGIYETKGIVEDGKVISVVTSNLKFKRRMAHDLVIAWVAADAEASLKKREQLAEKKLATDTDLAKVLDRLKFVHNQLPPQSRQAFRLMVSDYLQKR